tara:strand:+ start:5 stop:1147 length:1143 start_codon:yes stop_codon:yes gene_type:complete
MNFNFFLKTDISIGRKEFLKIPDHVSDLGSVRPGIIYDFNLLGNEYFTDNIEMIKKRFPQSTIVVNDLNKEPTYSYLEKKKYELNDSKPDLIIAIGGGSTIDLGKGIALLLKNDVPALQLKGFPINLNNPLPLITVPSIFGSGSEVSYNAVFIDENEGKKLGINTRKNFPAKSIIDPELTMTVPMSAVISSAFDTLVHCIDSFGSVKSTPLSQIFSIEGFHRTFSSLKKDNLDEENSRINLAIGSICGIIALMNSGDGPTNGFAYYFGVKDEIPHGLAGGIFLKEVMDWNFKKGFNDYSKLIKSRSIKSEKEANRQLFKDLNILYEKYDIPDLSHFGYKKNQVQELANKSSESLAGSFSGNPIPFDQNSAIDVINNLIKN